MEKLGTSSTYFSRNVSFVCRVRAVVWLVVWCLVWLFVLWVVGAVSVWIGGERAAVFSLQFSPEGILSQMCEQTLAVAVGGRGFGAEQVAEWSQVTAV